MGQAAIAPEPDPVTAAVGQPLSGTDGQRAVVGMLDGELEENPMRGPFSVAAAKDVGIIAKECGFEFQRCAR